METSKEQTEQNEEIVELVIDSLAPLLEVDQDEEEQREEARYTLQELLDEADETVSEEEREEMEDNLMDMDLQSMVNNCFNLQLKQKEGEEDVSLGIVLSHDEAYALMKAQGKKGRKTELLACQMLRLLEHLGLKLEKVLLFDFHEMRSRMRAFLRKDSGEEISMVVSLVDGLCLALLADCPLYAYRRFLPEPLERELGKMSMERLQRELDSAIRREAYEYASAVKKMMDLKRGKKTN